MKIWQILRTLSDCHGKLSHIDCCCFSHSVLIFSVNKVIGLTAICYRQASVYNRAHNWNHVPYVVCDQQGPRYDKTNPGCISRFSMPIKFVSYPKVQSLWLYGFRGGSWHLPGRIWHKTRFQLSILLMIRTFISQYVRAAGESHL